MNRGRAGMRVGAYQMEHAVTHASVEHILPEDSASIRYLSCVDRLGVRRIIRVLSTVPRSRVLNLNTKSSSHHARVRHA